MSNDPGDININVHDDVTQKEVMGPAERWVEPHNKPARFVTHDDLDRVLKDAQAMLDMCYQGRGVYEEAEALAHTQIESEDPLRFFVVRNGAVIINPVIIDHTQTPVDSVEGCLSFPEEPKKRVLRFNKIDVRMSVLSKDEEGNPFISSERVEKFSGPDSKMFQHEIGHLNGSNIYDEDYDPKKAIGEPSVDSKK